MASTWSNVGTLIVVGILPLDISTGCSIIDTKTHQNVIKIFQKQNCSPSYQSTTRSRRRGDGGSWVHRPEGEQQTRWARGYVSYNVELASRHQKRGGSREEGDFFFFPPSRPPGFDCFVFDEVVRYNLMSNDWFMNEKSEGGSKRTYHAW